MSVEYLPVGISCNLKCTYCYQEPMRDAGNITSPIDWSKAKAQLEKENGDFVVFGGEPLLAGIAHLREVFEFGLRKFGRNSIQTNGTLITDEHIKLFTEFNVGVGISVDGPGELNSHRRGNSILSTEEGTNRTQWAIEELCRKGRPPGLIVTIHEGNAGSAKKILTLLAWFRELESIGVNWINLHVLEDEANVEGLAMSNERMIFAFTTIYEWSKDHKIEFQPFSDIRRLLLQSDVNKVSCIWNNCDPQTTAAVHGISPDGTRSNCGRTNKDGVNWVKADTPGFERYLALYHTPQEFGGCADCRFFSLCRGQCPGTAIDKDWRNRTVHCEFWFALFNRIESELGNRAVTKDPSRLQSLEKNLLGNWMGEKRADGHGDTPHGDSHGDSDHGDSHGDHNDTPVTWVENRHEAQI